MFICFIIIYNFISPFLVEEKKNKQSYKKAAELAKTFYTTEQSLSSSNYNCNCTASEDKYIS